MQTTVEPLSHTLANAVRWPAVDARTASLTWTALRPVRVSVHEVAP